MQNWQPLAKAAIILGVSRQKLWKRLDYARYVAPYAPNAPKCYVHWCWDESKRRYLIDISRPDLAEVFGV